MGKPKNDSIDVWRPKIELPSNLVDAASSFTKECLKGIRQNGGVGFALVANHKALLADGHCDWHTDDDYPQFTVACVLRNDLNSRVEVIGVDTPEQPIGTLIILNVWRLHRLVSPIDPAETGVWLAAHWNFDEKPKRAEAERLMRSLC